MGVGSLPAPVARGQTVFGGGVRRGFWLWGHPELHQVSGFSTWEPTTLNVHPTAPGTTDAAAAAAARTAIVSEQAANGGSSVLHLGSIIAGPVIRRPAAKRQRGTTTTSKSTGGRLGCETGWSSLSAPSSRPRRPGSDWRGRPQERPGACVFGDWERCWRRDRLLWQWTVHSHGCEPFQAG